MYLAASYAANKAAAKMAAAADPIIAADGTNYRTGRSEWHAVSKEYFTKYSDHIRQKEKGAPIGMTYDWDTNLSSGTDFLFHRRRLR